MKSALATTCLALCLAAAVPVLAQQAASPPQSLDAQYKAAQIDVALATVRLGLVQVQMRIHNGQLAQARQELGRANALLDSLAAQTDVTAYRRVAHRLGKELSQAEGTQHRLAELKSPEAPRQPPIGDPGPGYGDPKIVDPNQPGLGAQVDLAVEQANLAAEHAYTNVPGSRGEMTTDPAVIRQRTLDHQRRWDVGRYAPARELIDVGKMLELDRQRVHYQYALNLIRDGARRDEMLHVQEATVAPPHVMNYPANWRQIEQNRAQYAEGRIWQSAPFKDTDGKMKTVAIYDVADLLFVPIFPGPSEYNVRRPTNPLTFWTQKDRYFDLFLYGPFSHHGGPGYGGGYNGVGGYYGYRVYDIIPPYYFPYDADPMYQYRLAQKRARLLQAVNRLMATQQD